MKESEIEEVMNQISGGTCSIDKHPSYDAGCRMFDTTYKFDGLTVLIDKLGSEAELRQKEGEIENKGHIEDDNVERALVQYNKVDLYQIANEVGWKTFIGYVINLFGVNIGYESQSPCILNNSFSIREDGIQNLSHYKGVKKLIFKNIIDEQGDPRKTIDSVYGAGKNLWRVIMSEEFRRGSELINENPIS
tara:strand:- start:2550 stop:3122 length:573 start_codon:yes stop_codon:yes gene_type:complete